MTLKKNIEYRCEIISVDKNYRLSLRFNEGDTAVVLSIQNLTTMAQFGIFGIDDIERLISELRDAVAIMRGTP